MREVGRGRGQLILQGKYINVSLPMFGEILYLSYACTSGWYLESDWVYQGWFSLVYVFMCGGGVVYVHRRSGVLRVQRRSGVLRV